MFIHLLFCLAKSMKYQILTQWHQYASEWRRCVGNHSAVIVPEMLMCLRCHRSGSREATAKIETGGEKNIVHSNPFPQEPHSPGWSGLQIPNWVRCGLRTSFQRTFSSPFWLVSIEPSVGVSLILIIKG